MSRPRGQVRIGEAFTETFLLAVLMRRFSGKCHLSSPMCTSHLSAHRISDSRSSPISAASKRIPAHEAVT